MVAQNPPTLDLAAAILIVPILYLWYTRWFNPNVINLPLPPSPKGWPIVGNLLDVPAGYVWKTYHSWSKKLDTTVLYLNMAGKNFIVLDTYEDCSELLEKRSSLYSGRARMPMVNELMGWDFNFGWMNYGSTWRNRRKLMHDAFHPTAVKSFRPVQLRAARRLLSRLSTETDFIPELRQMGAETIMAVAYGLDVKTKDDPHVAMAEEGIRALFEAAVPLTFLVDVLPILKYVPAWMPGASFKRKARNWRAVTEKMVNAPFEAMLAEMKKGTAKSSFSYNGMQTAITKGGVYNEVNVKSVAGTLYQTGADTTVSAVGFCVISLLRHPEIAEKIQAEIDLVTESSRLPDFGDEDSLPYLMASIKEIMRYWSPVPLAVPHFLEVEDEYKGYRIPAQTAVIPNTWAILHNEEIFPHPFSIDPERFISGENLKVMNAHYNTSWGYGRRTCPGRYMAFSSIWITLAQILAVYDITKARDDEGNIIEPSYETASALLLMPQDYVCSFTPRSSTAEQLLLLAKESEW